MCKRARACANISREINGFLTVSETAARETESLAVCCMLALIIRIARLGGTLVVAVYRCPALCAIVDHASDECKSLLQC